MITETRTSPSISPRIVFDGKHDRDVKSQKWLVFLDGSPRWLVPTHYKLLQMLMREGTPATPHELADEVGVRFYQTLHYLRNALGFKHVNQTGDLRQYLDMAFRRNGYNCIICGKPLVGMKRLLCGSERCEAVRLGQLRNADRQRIIAARRRDPDAPDGLPKPVRRSSFRTMTAEQLLRLWDKWRSGKVEWV